MIRSLLSESAIRLPAGAPAEPGEHLGVDDAEPGAGQHGHGQLGHHRHVQGDPVARLDAEVAQHRGELVHPAVELLVGDHRVAGVLGLGHPDQRGLVPVPGQVPVDAVVAGVQLAADKPLPERRVAGVQRGVPVLVPVQQVGVFPEALREVLFREAVQDGRVGGVRLADELRRRRIIAFLTPVNGDRCLGRLGRFRFLGGLPLNVFGHLESLRLRVLSDLTPEALQI